MSKVFSEVLHIINGKNQRSVENPNGKYPIYGSGGIMGYADDYLCEAETVIIGRKGSINKPIYIEEPFWNVDTAFGLVADKTVLLPRYLFYFCVNYDFEKLNRTVTIPSLTKSDLLKVEINLPDIIFQQKVVERLDSVENCIKLYQIQLQKLDELIKSRFVEMFGDMIINPFDWKQDKLGKVCDVRDGTHDSPSYCDIGYPLVTSKNVTNGTINFSDCNYICEADFTKINVRSKVDIGDILMPMIGTIGKPVIVETAKPFAIKNVALVKFFPNGLVNNTYIHTILKSDYFDRMVISKIRGGTQKFIALGDIRELTIAIPPLKLQYQFADFVTQVEKQKATVQKSIKKLETLKKSLMQEYFG